MRLILTLAALVAMTAMAHAQAPAPATTPTVEVSDDLKKLNGYWKPESVVADGTEQMSTPEAKASILLRIRNGEYCLFAIKDLKSDQGLRLCMAQLTVDAASHSFVLTVVDGYRKGQRLHGIYDHAGDRLRICYGPENQPRPTSFEAPKGTSYFCETWVTEKK